MTQLTSFLDTASQAYYRGQPIITDEQFDKLADSCGYGKVGAQEAGKVIKHYRQMFSLQKFYEDEGKNRPLEGVGDVSASVKLDGAAISLLYVDGQLVRALTRGDGIEGQDITDKLRGSTIVPQLLNPDRINVPPVLQVTGEIVAPINISNARNYAAGALNLKSPDEFRERVLSFIAYGVYPYITTKHSSDMAALRALGFGVCNELNLEKIFPSDGMVFRVNSNELFDEMGYTSRHPRGAYALKIRAEHVETKLLDVEWQVGKSGKVTPVAILEPVLIGDALVSRATLNNPGFIEALGLEIGDTVAVIRSGEVIPCILHKVDA
jgi:NAD-dependent DNA ligase